MEVHKGFIAGEAWYAAGKLKSIGFCVVGAPSHAFSLLRFGTSSFVLSDAC